MGEKTPFQKFIELISFDQQITSLEQRLKQFKQEVSSLKSQEADFAKRAELLRRAFVDAQKNVDLKELEMKSLEHADQEKKERLKLTTGQKEYKSLKIEIERVHQKQHTLEQELLAAWKQRESAQKAYEEQEKNMTHATQELQEKVREKQSQIDQLTADIAQQAVIRPAKEDSIPAEWLEKYAMMRAQVEDPVVPVYDGSCSACYYKVTDSDMQHLRRNKLLQCKDCYRFLYIPGSETTDSEKQ